MKTISLVFLMVVLVAISFIAGYYARYWIKTESIYELEKPLRITTKNPDDVYLLPAGTALYLDWQPPEGGFERYRIYVNVHGAAFPVKKVEKFNLIIPLTTFNDGYDD